MQVEARKVEFIKVNIDRRSTLIKIMDDFYRFLRPDVAAEYDDWFIDDSGEIIGITEYPHGSDSYTKLGPATPRTVEVYRAVGVVRGSIDLLPVDE